MLKKLRALYGDERGITMVEWAIMVGLVAAGAIAAGVVYQSGVSGATTTINSKLQNAVTNAGSTNNW